jgi:hypothetical protein
MNNHNTLKNKKEFDIFLLNKNNYLKTLAEFINKETLVFNHNEVKKISNYFINKSKENSFHNEDKLIFITYLGEFLIHNYGGEWFFTGNNDAFSPNEPYIGKSEAILIRECPSDSIISILTTQNENYFVEKLEENLKKKKGIDDVFSKIFPQRKKK